VKNGIRHSLARIPLRWMIRECFKAHTGIIFDAHMLKHELGLDIESLHEAPKPLLRFDCHLSKPNGGEIVRPSLTSTLVSPFCWVWSKLPQIRSPGPPPQANLQHGWKFEGEAQEELDDALSPIYDQLEEGAGWQILEFFSQNNGLGRIVDHRLKVHRSVRARILARSADGKDKGYVPVVRCTIKGEAEPRRLKKGEWLANPPKHFEWVD
jgi:hypothetical protein